MKIFYLITKSETGGAQTHIFQLVHYLINQGNKIAVMAYPGGWLEEKIKNLGGIFYPNKYLSNKINPLRDLKGMKKIKKGVDDFKPDLISCHSTKAGFLGRLTIRNKIPTIFTAHGWGFTPGTPTWRKILIKIIEKIATFYCQKIICVSNFDKNLALENKIAPSDKIIVIHNGTEIPEKLEKKIIKEKIKVIFIGRLTEPKDPLLLLEAFNELADELKLKSEILIIGEGEKRKKLLEFIKKNKLNNQVKLLGGLSREKTLKILAQADIFVLTSNYEGFPRTILEAMSYGLAIIASDVGGIKEAIENCGVLIKKKDKEGLKKILTKLLKNPQLIQEMGEKAREKAKENFPLEKMLKKTEEIYFDLLKNG